MTLQAEQTEQITSLSCEVIINNVADYKSLVAATKIIAETTEHVNLCVVKEYNDYYLAVRTMDNSHIALLDMRILCNKTFQTTDSVPNNWDNMSTIYTRQLCDILRDLAPLPKCFTLTLRRLPTQIHVFVTDTDTNMQVSSSTIDTEVYDDDQTKYTSLEKMCPLPKIEFDYSWYVSTDAFSNACKKFKSASIEYVSVLPNSPDLHLTGRGDHTSYTHVANAIHYHDAEKLANVQQFEAAKKDQVHVCTYSFSDYITPIITQIKKIADFVVWDMSVNKPCKLSCKSGAIWLEYYLAPRVED